MARRSPLPALPDAARKVWQVAMVVRGAQGFVLGVSLYTWGPFLYEQLVQYVTPSTAITLTTFFFGLEKFLITVLEVPTGAFGDAAGRKLSVVYSFACWSVAYLVLATIPFTTSLPFMIGLSSLFVLCFALYYTFFSGSFTAWCIEKLRVTAPEVGYEQILAPAQTTNALTVLAGALLGIGGYAAGWAWLTFLIAALVAAGCMVYCLGEMQETAPGAAVTAARRSLAQLTTEMGNIIGTALRVVSQSRAVAALVLLSACYLTLVNFVGLLWPIYVRSNFPGTPQVLAWLGLAVVTQLAAAGGSHMVTRWTRRHVGTIHSRSILLRRLLITGCLVGGALVLGLSLGARWHWHPFWLFLLTVTMVRLGFGVVSPTFETLLNYALPHSHARERATVLSFASFVNGVLVFVLAFPTSGPSGEHTTMGWLVPAILLLIVTLIGHRILVKTEREAPRLRCETEAPPISEEEA